MKKPKPRVGVAAAGDAILRSINVPITLRRDASRFRRRLADNGLALRILYGRGFRLKAGLRTHVKTQEALRHFLNDYGRGLSLVRYVHIQNAIARRYVV